MSGTRGHTSFFTIESKKNSLWLSDRQPVKVFKSLNDLQSDIFLRFKKRRKASECESFRSKVVSIEGRFDRNKRSVRSKTKVTSIEE